MASLFLFTFKLSDGRKVTYEGMKEKYAFIRTQAYHGAAVLQLAGQPTQPCRCEGPKSAEPVRQAGWLICCNCAGYIS